MVGFIGCGNMASAIIKGMVSSGFVDGGSIAVFDIDGEKVKSVAAEYGVKVLSSEKDIAEECTTVVLAVKPNIFPSLLSKIGDTLEKNDPLILSIAAGKTLGYIAELLPYTPRAVRIMPNINAKVCAAVSAFCGNERVGKDDLMFVEGFCNSFGKGVEIKEELFSIYSAIGGCSPAFVYMFIDALARAAVKNGMTKAQSLEVAAQAVLGSAKMLLESEEHPWELVDQVCSPGGTTIEGVAALQNEGFEATVTKAVEASFNKDKKL